MCVAIPGIVRKVSNGMAEVDFNGNCVNAMAGLVDVQPGQYALVHAGCIIQTMTKSQAEEILDLMDEMGQL